MAPGFEIRARLRVVSTLLGVLAMAGCVAGQNYRRPVVDTPGDFRGHTSNATLAHSVGDEEWAAVFADETLRLLIAKAVLQNYDLRIAAARIEQARAAYGLSRADRYPTVTGQVHGQVQSGTIVDGEALPTAGLVQIGAGLSWELDFWGRYRRATEAARAALTASEWGRRAIVTSLIGEVATLYFAIRALDLELAISRRTLASREESLRLTEIRERGGVTPLVDVRQAQQLVYAAQAQITDTLRQIEQSENFLTTLLGEYPGSVPRGRPLTAQTFAPEVPSGLPSSLLDRRPDIQLAEQQLVAANARVGVAKAAFFPQISLTALGGVASTALTTLFSGGAWSAGAGLSQPLFNAGRNRSNVALAEAAREERELVYRQTIQQAFREVSDALTGYKRQRELRNTQEALVTAAQDARRLADLRYQGGATSYLEVLDSETRLFTAELGLVQAQLSEAAAFVEIYRALGGGWERQ